MTSMTKLEVSDALEWCEQNVRRTVVTNDDEQGSLSGYSLSDGICWVTVDMPDGSAQERPSNQVRLVDF